MMNLKKNPNSSGFRLKVLGFMLGFHFIYKNLKFKTITISFYIIYHHLAYN